MPWFSSVCLSVWDGTACIVIIRCFSTDLSLWLDSPMFWAPWHKSMSTYFQPPFSSSTWKRGGAWMYKLGMVSQERLKIEVKLLLSANRKSYMPRRLAQQRMTLSDLEWPFHTSRAISAVAELLVSMVSSAGWAIHHISWSKLCLCLCVWLDVNEGGTNRYPYTQTCNPAYTDLWSLSPTKTRSLWPTSLAKILPPPGPVWALGL